MTFRAVAYSDHHSHPHKDKATILPNGRNSRLQDSLDVLDYIHCEKVDAFLFCGDMFHDRRKLDIDAFNETFKRINRRSDVPEIMVPGNHDHYTKDGSIHSLASFDQVTVVDEPCWSVIDVVRNAEDFAITVYGVPYSDDAQTVIEAIDEGVKTAPKNTFKILMLHQGLNEAQMTSMDTYRAKSVLTLGNLQASEWDLIISGHYHIPQKLAKNVFQVGGTYQRGWIEANELRGYWILTVDKKKGKYTWTMEHKETNAPQFHTTNMKSLGKTKKSIRPGDFVRVVSDTRMFEEAEEHAKDVLDTEDVEVEMHYRAEKEEVLGECIDISNSTQEMLEAYVELEDHYFDPESLLRRGQSFLQD